MKKNFTQYYQAVAYLTGLRHIPIQADYERPLPQARRSFFLKRFAYFLRLLGNPHKKLRYVHVGGSTGKGSVATMIQAILTDAGYTTGLFTSPYTTTTIEKFQVGKRLIAPQEFADLVERIKPAIDRCYTASPYGRPSYFEICTAIAFLYFVQKKCQYAVIEVGLGGKYDSTNVIPPPAITIVNSVDHDHTELLGHTLQQIAKEKAGIIKPGTVFLTGPNRPAVVRVLHDRCKQLRVPFVQCQATGQYRLALSGE